MGLSGCTSKKAAEEETTADVAEVAGEAGDDVAATEDAPELGDDGLSAEEQLPDDSAAPSEDVATSELGNDFATPAEELSDNPEKTDPAMDDMAAAEPPSEPTSEPTPEPMSEPPPTSVDESLAAGGAGEEIMEPPIEAPKKITPLRKIADAPYEQSGILVNAVYIARKGDDLDGIANKIFGSLDKKKELVKLNPILKNRGVKVGDKIYYNSPQRPTDNQRLLTYYEDIGLAPETYAVNKPENIREIAKKLLGDSNSWKELWSINLDLESKGELPEGVQLRYWAASATTAAPPLAAVEPGLETPPPSAPMETAEVPAPPPMEQPPVDQSAMNTPPPEPVAPPMETPPPPPPMEAAVPPPPPPVDTAQQQHPADAPVDGETPSVMGVLENPDQTMAMGAGAIVLLGAVAIFIMIRKRKARRQIDFHTSTQTQID